MTETDELVDIEWVAKILRVKPKTISNWISNGKDGFPVGFKLGTGRGSPRRWRKSTLIDYVNSLEQAA